MDLRTAINEICAIHRIDGGHACRLLEKQQTPKTVRKQKLLERHIWQHRPLTEDELLIFSRHYNYSCYFILFLDIPDFKLLVRFVPYKDAEQRDCLMPTYRFVAHHPAPDEPARLIKKEKKKRQHRSRDEIAAKQSRPRKPS